MKFKIKNFEIEATQWFKNGDHPLDNVMRPFEDTGLTPDRPREGAVVRYFRHPTVRGESLCLQCQKPMNDHGFIDQKFPTAVCPGSYVVIMGDHYHVMRPDKFEAQYEPV